MKYVDFKAGLSLADVGTGAGFPGLPLLIANPKLEVNFIDSSGKRINFIKDVLSNIGIIAQATHERAEDAGKNPDYREQYDYVTARAVAPLNVLCEYCIPLVKVGGVFVSLKGANGIEELEGAKNAIDVLGGASLLILAHIYKRPFCFPIPRGCRIACPLSTLPKKPKSKPMSVCSLSSHFKSGLAAAFATKLPKAAAAFWII